MRVQRQRAAGARDPRPLPDGIVDANVERRSRKEDRPPRTDGVEHARQIEGVPTGGRADQDGVKTARYAPDRGDDVGRTVETDRLISERRQDFLVAEQTVAVVVNDEYGFALAKWRRGSCSPLTAVDASVLAAGSQISKRLPFPRRAGNIDCAVVITNDLAGP